MERELKIWLQCTPLYEVIWLFHLLSLLISLCVLYFIFLFILCNCLVIFHILWLCAVFSTPSITAVPPSHNSIFFCYFLSLPLLEILSLILHFLLFPIPWWFTWVFILFIWVTLLPSFLYKPAFTPVSNFFSLPCIGTTSGILNWKTKTAVTKQTHQAFSLHLFIKKSKFLIKSNLILQGISCLYRKRNRVKGVKSIKEM